MIVDVRPPCVCMVDTVIYSQRQNRVLKSLREGIVANAGARSILWERGGDLTDNVGYIAQNLCSFY